MVVGNTKVTYIKSVENLKCVVYNTFYLFYYIKCLAFEYVAVFDWPMHLILFVLWGAAPEASITLLCHCMAMND